jgi:hypothetical protein
MGPDFLEDIRIGGSLGLIPTWDSGPGAGAAALARTLPISPESLTPSVCPVHLCF